MERQESTVWPPIWLVFAPGNNYCALPKLAYRTSAGFAGSEGGIRTPILKNAGKYGLIRSLLKRLYHSAVPSQDDSETQRVLSKRGALSANASDSEALRQPTEMRPRVVNDVSGFAPSSRITKQPINLCLLNLDATDDEFLDTIDKQRR